MKAASLWPLAIVGVLGVTVAANVVLYVAAGDRSGAAVEPDYYRKAVAWDSTLAQERRDLELGWRLEARLEPIDERGHARLVARLLDREGRPLEGARVTVTGIHNLDPLAPVIASLEATGDDAYAARLALPHPGLWEMRFEIECLGQRFTADRRLDGGPAVPRVAPR